MRRFAIHSGLSMALVLAALVAAGAAAPPPGVNTTITFVDPAAPQYQANVGELKGTFHATAGAGGTWSVSATFKPHALEHGVLVLSPVGLPYWVWTQVRQTASATVAATTGQPVQFTASGLRGANGSDLVVACTLTVGANGVVTVPELSLASFSGGGTQQ
jgi:hypothetical protein